MPLPRRPGFAPATTGIYRVPFCFVGGEMLLLHTFQKQTQKTSKGDLHLARERQSLVKQSKKSNAFTIACDGERSRLLSARCPPPARPWLTASISPSSSSPGNVAFAWTKPQYEAALPFSRTERREHQAGWRGRPAFAFAHKAPLFADLGNTGRYRVGQRRQTVSAMPAFHPGHDDVHSSPGQQSSSVLQCFRSCTRQVRGPDSAGA